MKAIKIICWGGLAGIVLTGFYYAGFYDGKKIGCEAGRAYLPSIMEIQEKLGVEQDGIIGKDTLVAWDKAICQREAAKWDFYYQETNEVQK